MNEEREKLSEEERDEGRKFYCKFQYLHINPLFRFHPENLRLKQKPVHFIEMKSMGVARILGRGFHPKSCSLVGLNFEVDN